MSEKEKKNKEAMSKLFSGLTKGGSVPEEESVTESAVAAQEEPSSAPEKVKPKGRRGRPPRSEEWETAYAVVNKERYGKIKEIAQMSGKNIKDIIDNAFADYIKKFENKYGIVRIRRKIDLDAMSEE